MTYLTLTVHRRTTPNGITSRKSDMLSCLGHTNAYSFTNQNTLTMWAVTSVSLGREVESPNRPKIDRSARCRLAWDEAWLVCAGFCIRIVLYLYLYLYSVFLFWIWLLRTPTGHRDIWYSPRATCGSIGFIINRIKSYIENTRIRRSSHACAESSLCVLRRIHNYWVWPLDFVLFLNLPAIIRKGGRSRGGILEQGRG